MIKGEGCDCQLLVRDEQQNGNRLHYTRIQLITNKEFGSGQHDDDTVPNDRRADRQIDSEGSVYNCLLEEGWAVGEQVYKDNNVNNRTPC